MVLGVRSGVKTRDNALWQQRPPALLQDLAGVHVEEYFALREPIALVPAEAAPAWLRGTASIWAEWLVPGANTIVLARYAPYNGWLDAQAAITLKRHPNGGAVWTLGAWLDEPLHDALIGWIAEQAGVQPVLPVPLETAHVMRRGSAYIVIAGEKPARFELPWRAREHLSGTTLQTVALPPWGVAGLTPEP